MLKQIIALVVISLAVVFFMSYAQQVVQFLLTAHNWVAGELTGVFSGGQAGNLVRGLLALLAIPLFIALIPTTIYWGMKRHWFPYFMQVVWVVWLLQAGAMIMLAQAA